MLWLVPIYGLLLLLALILPEATLAYEVPDLIEVIDILTPGMTQAPGDNPGSIAAYMANLAIPAINIVCIVMIIISGFAFTLSQNEQQVAIARNTALSCMTAMAMVFTAGAIRDAIFQPDGSGIPQNPNAAATGLRAEVLGLIEFVQIPVATLAVLMIIISGLRAIFMFGKDGGIEDLRRTVFSVLFGMGLIVFKFAFSESVTVTGNVEGSVIPAIISIMNKVLGYVALFAVIMIVVAGILMIVNIGNDEQYQKARTLILRVAIGLLIIIASLAIVNFVVLGTITGSAG